MAHLFNVKPLPKIVLRFREIFRSSYLGSNVDISRNIFKRNRVNVDVFFDGGSIMIHTSAGLAKHAISSAIDAFRGNTVAIESTSGDYSFQIGERLAPGETRTVSALDEAKERLAKLRMMAALREINAAI